MCMLHKLSFMLEIKHIIYSNFPNQNSVLCEANL